MVTLPQTPCFLLGKCAWTTELAATVLLCGCKPPPPTPAAQPAATASATSNAPEPANTPPATTDSPPAATAMVDGLPADVIENYEQLIKLTAEYNARAEKITDRQTYVEQSGSLAELENELSFYVEFMEAAEAKLSAAQRATLDSKYYTRAKPLIDAKRQHKMRLLSLVQ